MASAEAFQFWGSSWLSSFGHLLFLQNFAVHTFVSMLVTNTEMLRNATIVLQEKSGATGSRSTIEMAAESNGISVLIQIVK